MGKGRDKRRRKAKRGEDIRAAKIEPLGESPGPADPYSRVRAPLKPKPTLRSGAIALAEPDAAEMPDFEAPGARFSK